MSEAIEYERVGDIAVLKANNPPVNALGMDVRAGLIAGVERAEAEGADEQEHHDDLWQIALKRDVAARHDAHGPRHKVFCA